MAEYGVIGYKLEEARKTLENLGIQVLCVYTTSPPRNTIDSFDDNFRVVKVIERKKNKLELVVCKECEL